MFSKLNQKFPKSNEIYLTTDDAKALLAESVDNVILESFSDSDVVSATSEEEIYRILESMMTSGKEIVTAQRVHMWNWVFWNDDNYRPDKIASTLNEVYLKTEKEIQPKIVAAISDSSKSSLDIGTTLEGYGISFGLNYESSSKNSRSANSERERRLREFGENCLKLAWTGERFVPKPLELTRINLSSIRNKQVYRDLKTRVSYSSATLSMSVNVVQSDRITELVKKETNVVQSIQQKLDDVSKHTRQQDSLVRDLVGEVKEFKKVVGKLAFVPDLPVHFCVARDSGWHPRERIITYEVTQVNEGNAVNAETGRFTAPVAGIYSFDFSCSTNDEWLAWVHLKMEGPAYKTSKYLGTGHAAKMGNIHVHVNIELTRNQVVYAQFGREGSLSGNTDSEHHTIFSGSLLVQLPSN